MRALTTLFVALAATAGPALGQDGGIEVLSGETLFEKGTRVSLTHLYEWRGTLLSGSDEVPNPQELRYEDHRVVLGLDHGLRPDLTISALMPAVSRRLESSSGNLDSAGLGDLAVFAKYRAWKRDWEQSTINVAVVGGAECPTGVTDATDGGALLPPPLQPGRGAWSPFAALGSNLSLDRWRFDAHVFHKWNGEGSQGWQRGDFLSLEVDAAWRFLFTRYPGPTASAKLGLQWRREESSRVDGATLANTGNRQVRLRPGVVWHPTPEWDIVLAVDLPVAQDVNGTQLGFDGRTWLAIGVRF